MGEGLGGARRRGLERRRALALMPCPCSAYTTISHCLRVLTTTSVSGGLPPWGAEASEAEAEAEAERMRASSAPSLLRSCATHGASTQQCTGGGGRRTHGVAVHQVWGLPRSSEKTTAWRASGSVHAASHGSGAVTQTADGLIRWRATCARR